MLQDTVRLVWHFESDSPLNQTITDYWKRITEFSLLSPSPEVHTHGSSCIFLRHGHVLFLFLYYHLLYLRSFIPIKVPEPRIKNGKQDEILILFLVRLSVPNYVLSTEKGFVRRKNRVTDLLLNSKPLERHENVKRSNPSHKHFVRGLKTVSTKDRCPTIRSHCVRSYIYSVS